MKKIDPFTKELTVGIHQNAPSRLGSSIAINPRFSLQPALLSYMQMELAGALTFPPFLNHSLPCWLQLFLTWTFRRLPWIRSTHFIVKQNCLFISPEYLFFLQYLHPTLGAFPSDAQLTSSSLGFRVDNQGSVKC